MKVLLCIAAMLLLIIDTGSAQSPDYDFVQYVAGSGGVTAPAIDVDNNSNIYCTGAFEGIQDFDIGPGTNLLISAGWRDIYIAKYDSVGNLLMLVATGGISREQPKSIIVEDATGNIYIAGEFQSTADLQPGSQVSSFTSNGISDIFVLKLDSAGNYIWAKTFGGVKSESFSDLALDTDGNIYITGTLQDTVDLDPGPGVSTHISKQTDYFITSLDSAGNFRWGKGIGGKAGERMNNIKYDQISNALYLAGYYKDTVDFSPGGTADIHIGTGSYNAFIQKINTLGQHQWVRTINEINTYQALSVATGPVNGDIYVVGNFVDTVDFNPDTSFQFNLVSEGADDCFVMRMDSLGSLIWAKSFGGLLNDYLVEIEYDRLSDCIFLSGQYRSSVDFDPGSAAKIYTAGAGGDLFIAKWHSSGNFNWAKVNGGDDSEFIHNVDINGNGQVYFSGSFLSSDIYMDNFHLINTSGNNLITTVFIGKLNSCASYYELFPDSVPHTWTALNLGSGISPVSYTWNWGDGSSSTGTNISHTYADSGFYNICLQVEDAAGCIADYCDSSTYIARNMQGMITINVVMSVTTDVADVKVNELIIYPNPAAGQLNFSCPDCIGMKLSVRVVDILGKTVLTDFMETAFHSIDVSELKSGLYYLTVASGEFNHSTPIVINR